MPMENSPSRTSRWRLRRSRQWSCALKDKDKAVAKDAARRLQRRGLALRGIAKHGWKWKIALMNEARRQKQEERANRERMDRLCRPWLESTREL
jgi:hypothetical protein